MFSTVVTLAPPPVTLRAAPRRKPDPVVASAGFAEGTMIRTIFGTRPVEALMAGDLLLSAQGQIVELRGVRRKRAVRADLVQIDPSALGLGLAPGDLTRPLIVAGGQCLAIRDWRTDVLFGAPCLTPARALVDGVHVRTLSRQMRNVFELEFDQPTVIVSNGLNALVSSDT